MLLLPRGLAHRTARLSARGTKIIGHNKIRHKKKGRARSPPLLRFLCGMSGIVTCGDLLLVCGACSRAASASACVRACDPHTARMKRRARIELASSVARRDLISSEVVRWSPTACACGFVARPRLWPEYECRRGFVGAGWAAARGYGNGRRGARASLARTSAEHVQVGAL